MKVYSSNNVKDIITINQQSVSAKDVIRIWELGSLDELIPKMTAEGIRRELLKHAVTVKQLTNRRYFSAWTEVEGFVQKCMQVRYVPAELFSVETEVLIWNDTVAIYATDPEVVVCTIEDPRFAAQQKALFDMVWAQSERLKLRADGSC